MGTALLWLEGGFLMRKILVSNDDGIDSEALVRLVSLSKKFGEVWVVAPCRQFSSMSHAANFWEPMEVWPVDFPVEGVHAYTTTGTPSDCVSFGITTAVPGRPDVVFCGINKGYNIASGIQYSATVGAALEAANQKVHTIAFSENHEGTHEVTDKYIEQLASELMDKPLGDNEIWNVNFPGCALDECRGVKYGCTISQETFFTGTYREIAKEGNKTVYRVELVPDWKGEEGTDLAAICDNYISVGKVRNYC